MLPDLSGGRGREKEVRVEILGAGSFAGDQRASHVRVKLDLGGEEGSPRPYLGVQLRTGINTTINAVGPLRACLASGTGVSRRVASSRTCSEGVTVDENITKLSG